MSTAWWAKKAVYLPTRHLEGRVTRPQAFSSYIKDSCRDILVDFRQKQAIYQLQYSTSALPFARLVKNICY